jgi:hypothetical protein
MTNLYKTSDIKISSDSMGAISAEHKYQGRLIDSSMFWASSQAESRKIGRRAAVEELKNIKAQREDSEQI